MNLADFCAKLESQLDSSSPADRIPLAVKMLSKVFKVQTGDIALFLVVPQEEMLKFAWPEKLQSSGAIPLNAKRSLVAKTLREQRGYLDNRFAQAAHGVVFEAFSGDSPVQKILSVPMVIDGVAKGVVQVSRKALEHKDAGADFSRAELAALQKIASIIGRHL
jgi:hypothetical protein